MNKFQLQKSVEISAFSILLLLALRRSFQFWSMDVDTTPLALSREILLWVLMTCGYLWLVKQKTEFRLYLDIWLENWPVLIFISIAALSMLWSVDIQVTLFKTVALIATTMAAAYVGVCLSPRKFSQILAWMGGALASISLLFALAWPEIGTHIGHPYFGSWRGIFWTRARLGSIMALINIVFLFQCTYYVREVKKLLFNATFYIFTLTLVVLSRSATSVILVLSLHTSFFILIAWLKWKNRLRKHHYIGLGIFTLFAVIALGANLDFFFGMLGREPNLTGRVPMWGYLLSNIFPQRPLLGYGFGAIWEYNSFRFRVQEAVGWPYPVIHADNGFLDILLNLGVIGLLVFLVVFVMACIRSVQYTLQCKNLADIFPIILMVYVLITNLSLSFFFELEFFVWFLLASILFITTPRPSA